MLRLKFLFKATSQFGGKYQSLKSQLYIIIQSIASVLIIFCYYYDLKNVVSCKINAKYWVPYSHIKILSV